MQSYNEMNDLVHSKIFENDQERSEEILQEFKFAEEKGAVTHTIARFPVRG